MSWSRWWILSAVLVCIIPLRELLGSMGLPWWVFSLVYLPVGIGSVAIANRNDSAWGRSHPCVSWIAGFGLLIGSVAVAQSIVLHLQAWSNLTSPLESVLRHWTRLFFSPAIEEWYCRGVFWLIVASRFSKTGCVFLTSALFVGLHRPWMLDLSSIMLLAMGGYVLGVIRSRTQSLVVTIWVHIAINSILYLREVLL